MLSIPFDTLLSQIDELTSDQREQLLVRLQAKQDPNGSDAPTRTLYDELAARGIIGSIDDGPGDIGSNPKYMEGFGGEGS